MPSPLQLGLSWLRAPANEIAFLLRSTLRWQRGEPTLANEDKHDLFAHLAPAAVAHAAAVAADLVTRFDLAALAQRSSRLTFAGNLQHLAGLERLAAAAGSPPVGPDGVVRALDVGCGDFHYASALAAWLARIERAPLTARYVEHGVSGLLRHRADEAEWASAIAEFLAHPERAQALRAGARQAAARWPADSGADGWLLAADAARDRTKWVA